jgi:hypothetical protein
MRRHVIERCLILAAALSAPVLLVVLIAATMKQ